MRPWFCTAAVQRLPKSNGTSMPISPAPSGFSSTSVTCTPARGGFERGGKARFPGTDHQQLGLFRRDCVLLADGVKVGNGALRLPSDGLQGLGEIRDDIVAVFDADRHAHRRRAYAHFRPGGFRHGVVGGGRPDGR